MFAGTTMADARIVAEPVDWASLASGVREVIARREQSVAAGSAGLACLDHAAARGGAGGLDGSPGRSARRVGSLAGACE
jgi:hypothetical protein